MYSCIIIDDEPYAIEGLKKYISNFKGLEVVNSFTDPFLALQVIQSADPVDLILLDIDMPKINGIELSRSLRNKTNKLVFTTGHTKYGYDAFKVDADDYLLKPYTLGEFLLSMNKLFPEEMHEGSAELNNEVDMKRSFLVKSKDDNLRMLNVKFEDIIAVESKMNYVMIHTKSQNITTYMTLSEIYDTLSQYPGFMKFQRSFIIAEDHIESITGNTIKMVNGSKITVGDYYRKNFVEFVKSKLIKSKRR